ncbi:hypothetical protein [Colwellia sp. E150_009]
MKVVKSVLIAATILVASFSANASSKIKYLSVKNDFVYFMLEQAKEHILPSCVATENSQLWAFELAEKDADQKLTLLTTAYASNLSISVQTANTCTNTTTIEKPDAINIG